MPSDPVPSAAVLRSGFLAAMGLLVLACGGGADAPTPAPAAPSEEAPTPTAAPAADAAPPDPLAGMSVARICADDSLALIRWSYDELHGGFHDLCCGPGKLEGDVPGADLCHMDWPFNDVPDCQAYDLLRNAIFARYGYPFSKARWQEEFAGRDWYQRREDFDSGWLSPVAQANVERLQALKEGRVGCTAAGGAGG